jgi:hypothetical protein
MEMTMKSAKVTSGEPRRGVYVPFDSVPFPPVIRASAQRSTRASLVRYQRNKIIAAIFGASETRSPAAHY